MDDIENQTRPVIGVLAAHTEIFLENQIPAGDQMIYHTPVSFTQMGGAFVVPVWVDQDDQYYEHLMGSLNGLVFPGMDTSDLLHSGYARTAHRLMTMAIKKNDDGVYFPIFGICGGFQTFITYFTGKQLAKTNTTDYSNRLETDADELKKSRLFSYLSDDVIRVMRTETPMWHHHFDGITVEDFKKEAKLAEFFHLLTACRDRSGVDLVVSSIEAKEYPFYGLQWHPEKYSFWRKNNSMPWKPSYNIVGQVLANFLSLEACKNNQRFSRPEELAERLIENSQSATKVLHLPEIVILFYKPKTNVKESSL